MSIASYIKFMKAFAATVRYLFLTIPSRWGLYNKAHKLCTMHNLHVCSTVCSTFAHSFICSYCSTSEFCVHSIICSFTVQLNSNLTLVLDYLWVFMAFIRVTHQCSHAICMLLLQCYELNLWVIKYDIPGALHKSQYESPYESLWGNVNTGVDIYPKYVISSYIAS